jgi:hypothetical protein
MPGSSHVRPHNRKRPAGEAGRFWGYYREERSDPPLARAENRLWSQIGSG